MKTRFLDIVAVGTYLSLAFIETRLDWIAILGQQSSSGYPTLGDFVLNGWVSGLHIIPAFLVARLLFLPYYSVLVVFTVMWRATMGGTMYAFATKYLARAGLDVMSFRSRMVALIVGLVYMYEPYSASGDTLSALLFVKALLPLYLLLLLRLWQSSVTWFALPSIVLAIISGNDPRSMAIAVPTGLFIIVVPELVGSGSRRRALGKLSVYTLHLLFTSLLTLQGYLIPRFVSTNLTQSFVPIPTVFTAFFYPYSNVLSILEGIDFPTVFALYAGRMTTGGLLILPIICIGGSLFLARRVGRYIRYSIFSSLALFCIAVLAFAEPLRAVWISYLVRNAFSISDSFKQIILAVRTPRIIDLTIAVTYAFLALVTLHGITKRVSSARPTRPMMVAFLLVALVLLQVAVWADPVIQNGGVLSSIGTKRVQDSGTMRLLINEDLSRGRVWIVPTGDEIYTLMGSRPYIEGASTMRYPFAFTIDPYKSPLLSETQTFPKNELILLLRTFGIKYVLVDNNIANYSGLEDLVRSDPGFTRVASIGRLDLYGITNDTLVSLSPYGIEVVGGLALYARAHRLLAQVLNSEPVPFFLDGPTCCSYEGNMLLTSPFKTVLDLVGSDLTRDGNALLIAPSAYADGLVWKPGFISDPHHGVWTYTASPGYSWESSYDPNLGFAYAAEGAELKIPLRIREAGRYDFLVRLLRGPSGGNITFNIGNAYTELSSKWHYNANEFDWIDLGTFNVGSHTSLSIRNVSGLNAINLIIAVPDSYLQTVKGGVASSLAQKSVMYLLDAMHDFSPSAAGILRSSFNVLIADNFTVMIDGSTPTSLFLDSEELGVSKAVFIQAGLHNITLAGISEDSRIMLIPTKLLASALAPNTIRLTSARMTGSVSPEYWITISTGGRNTIILLPRLFGEWKAESSNADLQLFPSYYVYTAILVKPRDASSITLHLIDEHSITDQTAQSVYYFSIGLFLITSVVLDGVKRIRKHRVMI